MKNMRTLWFTFLYSILFFAQVLSAQSFNDQFYAINSADSLLKYSESSTNLKVADDGVSLMLSENALIGEYILKPQNFDEPFNRGLPSWNAKSLQYENASLKILMRFEIDGEWQTWATVGYWDKHVWYTYGPTVFPGGEIDVDYVVLSKYCSKFQFKVLFERNTVDTKSPLLRQLAFFVSDSRMPVSIDEIVADRPEQMFIKTTHYYQYGLDPVIGPSICSPTTVCMIIKSFGISVEPLDFARRTYDDYWKMFGVWPRVVAHASEYGLNGVVNRYRSWSQAAEVLKKGGRIAMSVGKPLYTGHLVMLAGFNQNGDPIVHDPAKSNGEAYVFNKTDLSKSWFEKGGIAYTFYRESKPTSTNLITTCNTLLKCYPNPLKSHTVFEFQLDSPEKVNVSLYDIHGKMVCLIKSDTYPAGLHQIYWNRGNGIKQGVYFAVIQTERAHASYKLFIQE
jgi:hypothetical protein